MKTQATLKRVHTLLRALALVALGATSARADMWDYCARNPLGQPTLNFTATGGWSGSSATGSLSGCPGCFFYGASSGASPTVGFSIKCTGDTPNAYPTVWRLWYCQTAMSHSPDLVATISASAGTTLDANLPLVSGLPTTPYHANPGIPFCSWAAAWPCTGFTNGVLTKLSLLCYFTNAANLANPTLTFRYFSGTIDASHRWYADMFRFEEASCVNCCETVPAVSVPGPLYAGQTNLTVVGVSVSATAVTIYADGLPLVTNIIVGGVSTVPVPPLPLGKHISATQTIGGQEGCVSTGGTLVREWPCATTISNLVGTTLNYWGGGGAQFVLLGTNDLAAPVCTWPRLATNTVTPGAFTVSPPASAGPKFYRIQSE